MARATRSSGGAGRAVLIAGQGAAAIVLASVAVLTGARGRGPAQPIAYDHKSHTQDQSLPCTTCHRSVETGESAGRPTIAICLECHESALTESPEEEKIRGFAETGGEIPWVQLTRLESHVYFSPRRHVTVARLECRVCHGPMEMQTSPPPGPLVPITMSTCVGCHEKSGASLDCNACHR